MIPDSESVAGAIRPALSMIASGRRLIWVLRRDPILIRSQGSQLPLETRSLRFRTELSRIQATAQKGLRCGTDTSGESMVDFAFVSAQTNIGLAIGNPQFRFKDIYWLWKSNWVLTGFVYWQKLGFSSGLYLSVDLVVITAGDHELILMVWFWALNWQNYLTRSPSLLHLDLEELLSTLIDDSLDISLPFIASIISGIFLESLICFVWYRLLYKGPWPVFAVEAVKVSGFEHSFILFSSFVSWVSKRGYWFLVLLVVCDQFDLVRMAQSNLFSGKAFIPRTEVIKVSSLDIDRRIKQFHLTVIGRVWNPCFQNMESLIHNLPKFWKMEDKVSGADLGFGKFQFDFQTEEDLLEVLKHSPYHFDSWMVSVVRWEPIVDSRYPSAINFWVKVGDIPFQYWTEQILWAIGRSIGIPSEVDENSGSVRVTLNGFNQLAFQTILPFDNGEELKVRLEYVKLAYFCVFCHKITHIKDSCPDLRCESGSSRNSGNGKKEVQGPVSSTKSDQVSDLQRRKSVKRSLEAAEFQNRETVPAFLGSIDQDLVFHPNFLNPILYAREFEQRIFESSKNLGNNGKPRNGKRAEGRQEFRREGKQVAGGKSWPKPLYWSRAETEKKRQGAGLVIKEPHSISSIALMDKVDNTLGKEFNEDLNDDLFMEEGEFSMDAVNNDLLMDEEAFPIGGNELLNPEDGAASNPAYQGKTDQTHIQGGSVYGKRSQESREGGYPETTG